MACIPSVWGQQWVKFLAVSGPPPCALCARTNTFQDVEKIKEQFDRDGYIIFHDVIDSQLIEEANQHIAWLLKKFPDLPPEKLNFPCMRGDPFWARLISDDRLLDIAEVFIGSNIALFSSHYLCKAPHVGESVIWHQDAGYWKLKPMEIISLWLAINDVARDNGCMRVVPGTHHLGVQSHKDIDKGVIGGNRSSIDESVVDKAKAVDIELRPGDVSVHHPHLLHASNANHSNRWRKGLTIRYVPASTLVLDERHFPNLYLLRGNAVEGLNGYVPFPKYQQGEHMPFRGCEAWAGGKS